MVICLQWEGRSYTERHLRRDMDVCKMAFGTDKPVKVIGFDGGELFTTDDVPDFTQVLTIRGGLAISNNYNVQTHGLKFAPMENWLAENHFNSEEWARLTNVSRWDNHASLPHFLWWMMEVDSIMQQH
jgi:hypothetical protein